MFFVCILQTMEHLDDLANQYDFIETEVIGQSWEGRDLKIVKICKGGCGKKPAIWIDGGSRTFFLTLPIRYSLFIRRYPRPGVD